jgi:hypothetical protein
MKKCYYKEIEYVIPHIECSFCGRIIRPGEGLFRVVLTWGDGRTACQQCYDEYEIDWSMHESEECEV